MAFEDVEILRAVGAESSLNSALGRFCRKASGVVDGSDNGNLQELLRSCGGEIQLSSPRGQWLMRLAKAIDDGASPGNTVRLADASRGRGAVSQWDERIKISAT